MKKFLIYFAVIFLISFSILNSRFVSARIKFAFFERNLAQDFAAGAMADKPENQKGIPPVSAAKSFSLKIPAINAAAPVVLEKSADPNIIFKRLEDGVVHYVDTPLPGQDGTAVILGHSSAYPWYKGKYGSVFALLGYLKAGDKIYVNDGNKTMTFEVKESLIFNPLAKNSGLERLAATDGSSIILVSCWPVGTNYKRIAIKADLI